MVEEIRRTILYDIVVRAEDAVASINKYETEVNQVIRAHKNLTKAGYTTSEATAILTERLEDSGKMMDSGATQGEVFTEALRRMESGMEKTGSTTLQTSRILQRIFAAGIIGFVLGAIRKFTQGLKDAAKAGAELSRSLLDVAVQARALRRAGGEMLPSEWIQRTKALSEVFTQFAQKDINSAVSQLIKLGRQSNLTDEEIQGLIDQTLLLATVTGQDAANAANAVATAVESGYARGLKELIGAIDETTIAQEAIRRGFAETEEEVDKSLRAYTVYVLLQEEAAKMGGDLALIQDSLTGKYTENVNAIETLKATIGERLLPIVVHLQERFIIFLENLDEFISKIERVIIEIIAFDKALYEFEQQVKSVGRGSFKEMTDAQRKAATESRTFKEILQEIREEMGLVEGAGADVDDVIDRIGDAARRAVPSLEELKNALGDALIDIRELFIDLYNDIEKEGRRFRDDEADALSDYEFDLAKLADDLQHDTEKAWRTYYDRIAEATDDYHDKELEAEEDFQEQLRKLREDFLFNLEDALRERDARQVLRLIRQYNLRKGQMEREYELEKDQRKRQFQDELEDIQRQRDIRIRELQIEYQLRQAEMRREYEYEKAQRELEHQRRLAEEKIQAKERFDELLRELQDGGVITAKEAETIAAIFDEIFGSEGQIATSFDELVEIVSTNTDEVIRQLQRMRVAIADIEKIKAKHETAFAPIPPTPIEILRAEIGTLEAPTYEVDEDVIAAEAQKVTDAIDEEFGPDGRVNDIYQYLADGTHGIFVEDIPKELETSAGAISEGTKEITDSFNKSFGPDGTIDNTFTYLGGLISGTIQSVIDGINRLKAVLLSLRNLGRISRGRGRTTGSGGGTGMAEGGIQFASTPTTVKFGESGLEMAQFIPLDRQGRDVGKVVGGENLFSKRNDRVELLVRMQDGLIAEIVDTTLDQTATVILNVERARL